MRVLIILLAVGLVLIGIFPFRRDLRSGYLQVRETVKREFRDVMPGSGKSGKKAGDPALASTVDRGSPRAALKSPNEPSMAKKPAAKKPSLDRLSEDDRASLEELLNR